LKRVSENASKFSGSSTAFDLSEKQAETGDLNVIYYDPENPGSFGGVQSLSKFAANQLKSGCRVKKRTLCIALVQRRRIVVSGIDYQ